MVDWSTIANLGTAGGTLVLAVATFSSVRSGNRAARSAERSLLQGLRPVLVPSRLEDRAEKITWIDDHHTKLSGGRGHAVVADDNIYLALSLRNVGAGLAVIQGWHPSRERARAGESHAAIEEFRPQTRDLYIPSGDVSFWQGAIRSPEESFYKDIRGIIEQRDHFGVDLLYTDHEGGQRTVSRFALRPMDDGGWFPSVVRHWSLDRPGPR